MERVGRTTETTGSVGSLGSHAVVILVIVITCATLGTIEEYRAEKSMEALKMMGAPTAKVIRNGRETVVPASEIVLGDIVLLTHGDKVPADARVAEELNLQTDEAPLTGESILLAGPLTGLSLTHGLIGVVLSRRR